MEDRIRLTERKRNADRMLAEVNYRNLIAMYKDDNEKETKVAAIPHVGIFWFDLDGPKIYSRKVSMRNAENFAGNKIGPDTHYETWRSVKRENSSWVDMDYDEVPRGRVVFEVSGRDSGFVIYLPKELNSVKSLIRKHFDIPSGRVRFEHDEHYVLS